LVILLVLRRARHLAVATIGRCLLLVPLVLALLVYLKAVQVNHVALPDQKGSCLVSTAAAQVCMWMQNNDTERYRHALCGIGVWLLAVLGLGGFTALTAKSAGHWRKIDLGIALVYALFAFVMARNLP